ncbi:hypothetical protein HAX54_041355 [Datura stramonium]|uniref:Uncharacterized protein n=1 Tax=Datura stramonium TaxID=4076 RepID=A0ABS8VT40_DATST|nr:hypothetical protein [Datura stramonium]
MEVKSGLNKCLNKELTRERSNISGMSQQKIILRKSTRNRFGLKGFNTKSSEFGVMMEAYLTPEIVNLITSMSEIELNEQINANHGDERVPLIDERVSQNKNEELPIDTRNIREDEMLLIEKIANITLGGSTRLLQEFMARFHRERMMLPSCQMNVK